LSSQASASISLARGKGIQTLLGSLPLAMLLHRSAGNDNVFGWVTPLSIVRVEHVQLAMPKGQEAAARNFYGKLLGIPEKEKPAHLAKRGGVWFERDELKVHLGVDAEFRPSRKAHPGFVVEDLPALIGRLQEAGFEIRNDEPLEGWRRIYVDDPFGNRIELMEAERSS
jgi:catechol 2,3-dioxygenase-like lactoylglutathione lyase family enzyme